MMTVRDQLSCHHLAVQRRRRIQQYVGVGFAALVSGCALVSEEPPQVEVANVSLTAIGLLDQSLDVALYVTKPNQRQLEFSA
jgi:hypothetical protein